jgi:hypothetical protein
MIVLEEKSWMFLVGTGNVLGGIANVPSSVN